MSKLYDENHRALQREFDTERLADRIEERLWRDHMTDEDKEFIQGVDMFFLATADAEGRPNCSYKGGDPGFVRVVDERTLAFPSFNGNGMYLSAGNLGSNPHVGLLFVDFQHPKRLRLNGSARLAKASDLALQHPQASYAEAPYTEADFVMIVSVREVFPNCSRYVHKMQLVERSRFVPRPKLETPIPEWKRATWASDVLPDRSKLGKGERSD